MPRFYCPQPLPSGGAIDLPDSVAHHLRVVRLQAGDSLILFNGDGGEHAAELLFIDKKSARAQLREFSVPERELPYALTLAQALPEASKMDWIIEKAVELGVAIVAPLAADRCVVRLSIERAEKRQLHWQSVIVAAAEQSGRNILTVLAPVTPVNSWLQKPDSQVRILLSPRAERSLADWARATPPCSTTLMIGPEGGFSPKEEAMALAHGALALSMGPRVLRTETAGLAALATINAHWTR
jgi:16S rRNA (uracil1498-N3)-methyltransferase